MLEAAPSEIKRTNYAMHMPMQRIIEETESEHHLRVYSPRENQVKCITDVQDFPRSLHPEARGQERPPLSESREAINASCQAELNPVQGPGSPRLDITSQRRPASEANLPPRLQQAMPMPTCTRVSLPTLRHVLSMTGLGLLLTAAAAGGSTAFWLLIGQYALKMGRFRLMTCTNGSRSHGIGSDTTQYSTPHWPASPVRYKDSFPCLRSVPLAAALSGSGHSDRLQRGEQLPNSMAGSCQSVSLHVLPR